MLVFQAFDEFHLLEATAENMAKPRMVKKKFSSRNWEFYEPWVAAELENEGLMRPVCQLGDFFG